MDAVSKELLKMATILRQEHQYLDAAEAYIEVCKIEHNWECDFFPAFCFSMCHIDEYEKNVELMNDALDVVIEEQKYIDNLTPEEMKVALLKMLGALDCWANSQHDAYNKILYKYDFGSEKFDELTIRRVSIDLQVVKCYYKMTKCIQFHSDDGDPNSDLLRYSAQQGYNTLITVMGFLPGNEQVKEYKSYFNMILNLFCIGLKVPQNIDEAIHNDELFYKILEGKSLLKEKLWAIGEHFEEIGQDFTPPQPKSTSNPSATKKIEDLETPVKTNTQKSGCYIATAVYGSYDCPEVWTLRRFRDNVLAECVLGRLFVRLYYSVSPILVNCFGDSNIFKSIFAYPISVLVKYLQRKGFEDTPYIDREW